jgi:hypothetical protein
LNKTIENPSEKDFKILLNETDLEQSYGKKISPVFKITQEALNNLKADLIPDGILNKLQSIQNQEFVGEEKFLEELNKTLGDEDTGKYKTLIFYNTTISNHVPALLAAFQISAGELSLLKQKENDDLNLKNLSKLYRVVSLSKRLKLSIREFLSMRSMLGIDSFDVAHTEDTIRFVEKVNKIRGAGFRISDLDYLLRDKVELATQSVPRKDEIELLLWEIRRGLQNQAETVPVTDQTMDVLKKQISDHSAKIKLSRH